MTIRSWRSRSLARQREKACQVLTAEMGGFDPLEISLAALEWRCYPALLSCPLSPSPAR
jgi:hypothetical protein